MRRHVRLGELWLRRRRSPALVEEEPGDGHQQQRHEDEADGAPGAAPERHAGSERRIAGVEAEQHQHQAAQHLRRVIHHHPQDDEDRADEPERHAVLDRRRVEAREPAEAGAEIAAHRVVDDGADAEHGHAAEQESCSVHCIFH